MSALHWGFGFAARKRYFIGMRRTRRICPGRGLPGNKGFSRDAFKRKMYGIDLRNLPAEPSGGAAPARSQRGNPSVRASGTAGFVGTGIPAGGSGAAG